MASFLELSHGNMVYRDPVASSTPTIAPGYFGPNAEKVQLVFSPPDVQPDQLNARFCCGMNMVDAIEDLLPQGNRLQI